MTSVLCVSLATMAPTAPPAASVLCLGNFDGVHLAHQELLNNAKRLRSRLSADTACGVFCFSTSPSEYLTKNPPAYLCTQKEKLEIFRACGMDYAFVADFPAVRDMSPADFIQKILKEQCNCVGAVCGFNFRFGKQGAGTAEFLKQSLNAPVEIQDAVLHKGEPISSTRIRKCLSEGDAKEAAALLGRPYSFTAPVIHGKHLGHKLGAPTINQKIPDKLLIPAHGVYVTNCEIEGKRFRAVTNVGVRPTVEENATVNCESYLLDFEGNLYEKSVTTSFLARIRPEKQFSSQEELQSQIHRDIETARNY